MFASEEAFDNFIGGFLLGGGSNVISNVKANKQDKDAVTGYTKDEQAVVDKVFKDAVAEKEAKGEKLNALEKTRLYDDIVGKMEKGYIDTDIIEEVLGEGAYKTYKDTMDHEEDILKQYEELGKKTNPTLADQSLYEELKSQVKDIKANSQREALKSNLRQEVFGKVKGSKLAESYNERARRGQAFEADLSGYDAKQQEVIKRAVKSGILNNTNRTHEFVDLIARISADKGVLFDFANNKKLKESGFAIDGRTVNGFVSKDGITVNIDSHKALNSVVGHEITHVLEGTELYAEMQKALFDYAKSKKDFDGRRKDLEELYKGIKDADIDGELTADLVGDYLFTDEKFVQHLTQNRNVFQRIYDEIKYLWKTATAGSKEKRVLEKVKHEFEKAYKNSGKVKDGTTYSLSEQKTPTYKELVAKSPTRIVKITEGVESGSYTDMKAAALNKATSEGWFDIPHHNVDTDSLIFLTEKSFTHAYSNLTADFGEDTIRCMAHIPEIIKEAVLVNVADPKNSRKMESKVYTFFGAIDGVNGVEPVKLTVKEYDFQSLNNIPKNIRSYFEKNGIMESYNSLYDAHALEVIGIEGIKKESDASGRVGGETPRAQATSDSTISIADLLNLVKGDAKKYIPKFSLSDSDGNLNPTSEPDIRYSMSREKPLDKYTQKQYNDFGWAREAEAITQNELDDMYSKIHEKGSLKKFAQSSTGEVIIEVNDSPHTTLGVDNVFVFVTGTNNNPQINKVVRFQAETDTEMEIIKEKLYERGSFSDTYYSFLRQERLAREYCKKSALDYNGYAQKVWRRSSGADSNRTDGNSGVERNRKWTFAEAQSNEIAPVKKASSKDGVFFDGKSSLSFEDIAPVKQSNQVYGEDIRFEAPVQEQAAPVAEAVAETGMQNAFINHKITFF